MDPVAPLCQVSPNFPLPLYLISPLSYILPTCSQMLILNLPTSLYFNTPTAFLFTPPFSLNAIPAHPTPSSPTPPFLLFALFMPVPLLPASSLTLIHCMSLFYYALHHLSLLHPHPHFHFFGLIMVIPLPSTHLPYSFTSYTTILPYCNPLDNPLHPLPLPGPPPHPSTPTPIYTFF